MLYMQEVERMDGYGEESYPAKVSKQDAKAGALHSPSQQLREDGGRPRDARCAKAEHV